MTKRHLTFLTTGLLLGAGMAAADTPVLKVLTYDSFIPEWGPGPVVEAAFEEVCGCDLQFETSGDGAALLARIQLDGDRSDIDVILGLDQSLLPKAKATGLLAPHGADLPAAAMDWQDDIFVPYDMGTFAFVALKDTPAATSLIDLAASDLKVVIQDPRSSTPGLGLAMWVSLAYGDGAQTLWEQLADNIVTVTPGWSEAYGLFLEGEADAVLSYTSSPAYHRIAEEDDTKTWWPMDEGHYMQIEVAARLASSDQPDLATQFLTFLSTPEVQNILPTTNWMYPAFPQNATLPDGFEAQPAPKRLLADPDQVEPLRQSAVDAWRAGLTR